MSDETETRTTVAEAIKAWADKGPTSLTVALMADALYGADAEQAELRAENDRIWAEVEKHLSTIERLRALLRTMDHFADVAETCERKSNEYAAQVAAVRALAEQWTDKARSGSMSGSGIIAVTLAAVADDLRAALSSPEPMSDQCKTAKDTGSCDQCHDHLGRHKPCQVPDA